MALIRCEAEDLDFLFQYAQVLAILHHCHLLDKQFSAGKITYRIQKDITEY